MFWLVWVLAAVALGMAGLVVIGVFALRVHAAVRTLDRALRGAQQHLEPRLDRLRGGADGAER
ncbi:MAG: hypothetical protein ACRDN9_09585 [Streptosporangiaceae bacterium]